MKQLKLFKNKHLDNADAKKVKALIFSNDSSENLKGIALGKSLGINTRKLVHEYFVSKTTKDFMNAIIEASDPILFDFSFAGLNFQIADCYDLVMGFTYQKNGVWQESNVINLYTWNDNHSMSNRNAIANKALKAFVYDQLFDLIKFIQE